MRYLSLILALMATPAMAQDKMTLILDWFINPDHGPIILAEELGYFEEAGLEVEVVAPADPSDPPKMVAAGQADLAISYQPQLHLQIENGLPLRRVGTLVARRSTAFWCSRTGRSNPPPISRAARWAFPSRGWKRCSCPPSSASMA